MQIPKPDARACTARLMTALGSALMEHGTLLACQRAVRGVLSQMGWMTKTMKADVMTQAMMVARQCLGTAPERMPKEVSRRMDAVLKAFNRSSRSFEVSAKKLAVSTELRHGRAKEEPVVFYLVSSHQKPQKAHEPLQGTVLIDRFWRAALEGHGEEAKVAAYVRNRNPLTVQEAMSDPYYLIVRPNCRHKLIPLSTDEVLSNSPRSLRKAHSSASVGEHRSLTDHERWLRYKRLKKAIRDNLEAKI